MKNKWLVSVILTVIMVFTISSVVSAKGGNPPRDPDAVDGDWAQHGRRSDTPGSAGFAGPLDDDTIAELAASLGISVESLQEKLDTGLTLHDIATELGYTEEELQVIIQGLHDDFNNGFQGYPETRPDFGTQSEYSLRLDGGVISDLTDQIIADQLGITLEDYLAYRDDGLGLTQLFDQFGIAIEDIFSFMTDVRQEALQQAIDLGLITEDQAAYMLDHVRYPGNKR